MKYKSLMLVAIQLLSLFFIFLTGPVVAQNPILLTIEGFAFFLGLWAVYEMRTSVLTISPEVSRKSSLITTGPYRFIRHPMYASVIFIALALVLNFITPLRITVFLILLINLLLKINYEEKLLSLHFGEYETYKKKTKYRFIPFIY